MEYLKLEDYDRLSEALLARNNIPVNNENIAFVNECMMKADMVYDETRTKGNRNRFRIFYAEFACSKIKKKYLNDTKYNSLYSKEESFKLLHELPDNNTPYKIVSFDDYCDSIIQKFGKDSNSGKIFKYYIKENMNPKEIAELMGVSRQYIYIVINSFPKKLEFTKCDLKK